MPEGEIKKRLKSPLINTIPPVNSVIDTVIISKKPLKM